MIEERVRRRKRIGHLKVSLVSGIICFEQKFIEFTDIQLRGKEGVHTLYAIHEPAAGKR